MSDEAVSKKRKKKRKKGRRVGRTATPVIVKPRFEFPWIAVTAIAIVLGAVTFFAWPARPAPEPHVRRGNEHYGARRYQEALGEYESAPGSGARNAGVQLDRGLARFRLSAPGTDAGPFSVLGPDATAPEGLTRAQDEFRTAARGGTTNATEDVDVSLRSRAAYDLGNAFFAQRSWDNAIDAFKEALRLTPGFRDAAWNLELARRLREADRNPPDAGPDAAPDAAQDAAQDAADSGRDSGPDSGPDGGPDAGPDGGMDSGRDSGNNGQDSGQNGQDSGQPGQDSGQDRGRDSGSQGQDAGPPPGRDGGTGGQDAQAPRSLSPLDDLDRTTRSLQDEMMRRRGVTPRSPEDDRK